MNAQKKPRGRPRADKNQTQADNSRVDLELSRDEQAHSAKRPPRVAMGTSLILEFGDLCNDPKYHYHVISGKPGRVAQAKQGWYEHVKDHNGDNVTRQRGPNVQYLMRIEKKYWDEDQQLKQKRIADTLKQKQVLGKEEYLPDDRHHVIQKDDYDPLS